MPAPEGRRSLLRRPLGVLGATLAAKAAPNWRRFGSQGATAGNARAVEGNGDAAIPRPKARAPAVAIALIALASWLAAPGFADDTTPPPAAPTTTVPDAPPPDAYQPPAKASTAKPAAPKRSAPVVRSAPAVRAPTASYAPSPAAPAVAVRRVSRPHVRKKAPKPKRHTVHRHVAAKPKPVQVNFNPFASFAPDDDAVVVSLSRADDRDRYLWLAGFAFALLSLSGLSLQLLFFRVSPAAR